MSCFIVKNESILKIVKGFDCLSNEYQLKNAVEKVIYEINVSYNTYLNDIKKYRYNDCVNICCNQLRILNLLAYKACYPEKDGNEPYLNNMDFIKLTINNPLNLLLPNSIYQYVKTLECFLYQCSEGNIPDYELYKALQNLVIEIKCWVFNKNQAYKNAEWE